MCRPIKVKYLKMIPRRNKEDRMVKVLEHGNRYHIRKIRCDNCNCLFEFDIKEDVTQRREILSALEHKEIDTSFVFCPECNKDVLVGGAIK
jgi:uncharacterized protein with PIN domain